MRTSRRSLAIAALAAVTFAWDAPAAVFTVTNTLNTGVGSLRQAITDANAATDADIINFNIGGGSVTGVQVIALTSALPTITSPVSIDGYKQPGSSVNTLANGDDAVIRIEIRGVGTGNTSGASGLVITAGNSLVRGLAINGFPGRGIDISGGSGNNRVEGCFIGTDAAGLTAVGNSVGVAMSVGGNVIGGTTPAARNVISGSTNQFGNVNSHGVSITGGAGNMVQGNFIGTNRNGTGILRNNGAGVAVASTGTTIGGASSAARNIISGNNQGITVSAGAIVQGNFIGLDVNGTVRLPNTVSGISLIAGANTIGGAVTGAGNVISGNNGNGIVMDAGSTNTVQGNFIGTNAAGTAALPNSNGIVLDHVGNSSSNTIGGETAAKRNVIAGNTGSGIILTNPLRTLVHGNFIGVAADGVGALGNGVHGVVIAATDQAIGGVNAGEGNLIAFNKGDGVRIQSGTSNRILQNSIHANGALGIDLGGDGRTNNDPLDPDTGANNLQNYPVLTSAGIVGGNVEVNGRLNSQRSANYRLEFFKTGAGTPSAQVQGQTFLGFANVATDANGNVNFVVTFAGANANDLITATATDAVGNTSEFSLSVVTAGPSGKPPVITSPLFARMTVGRPFVYLLRATENPTSYGAFNLPAGLEFNPFLNAIVGTPTQTGDFSPGLTASNQFGSTSETLALAVQDVAGSGLVIISAASSSGRVGRPFDFQVITSGGSGNTRVSATNLPPGLTLDPVSGLISGTPSVDGSWGVTLTATDGNTSTSETLQLTFIADPAVPVIISENEATLVAGQPFSYTIEAPASVDGSEAKTFTRIGPLPAGLEFNPGTGTISGTFTPPQQNPRVKALSGGVITNVQLFATNPRGTSTISLVFFLAPSGVVNISTRLAIGTDENVLIGGFIVTGNAPKKVIIRALGPSLQSGGLSVAGALQDPQLELHEGETTTTPLGTNDDWRSSQENEIIATGIPPPDNREPALIAILQPGAYTAIVSGKNNSTGIGLVEVYDLGTASLENSSNSRLANISTRGFVQTGDNVMIGGFIVSGGTSRVLVRGIGPSLAGSGVTNALQDTTLDLFDGNGSLIVSNDNWRTGGQEQQIEETTVPPSDDRESAIIATLNPGAYTAIVRGKDATTGVALVEVFVLQ